MNALAGLCLMSIASSSPLAIEAAPQGASVPPSSNTNTNTNTKSTTNTNTKRQWLKLVTLGPEEMMELKPWKWLRAPGIPLSVSCGAEADCNWDIEEDCCSQVPGANVVAQCVPIGTCATIPSPCYAEFAPDYCGLVTRPGVELVAPRCSADDGDKVAVDKVLGSSAFAALTARYSSTWPATMPFAPFKTNVLARVDADGDGVEDVLVRAEIVGSVHDPRFSDYTLHPDPPECERVFVVSGDRVSIAGDADCAGDLGQEFKGIAGSRKAAAPLLLLEVWDYGAGGFMSVTWNGKAFVTVHRDCFGNG